MNILITGATGFIGCSFLKYIKDNRLFKNDKIILLTSKKLEEYECVLHKNYTFAKSDFKDVTIDVILHLGGFSPHDNEAQNDVLKNLSSIVNTKYLLDNLPNIPKKIIFSSSIAVYDFLKINEPITELTPACGMSMYGLSKLMQEKILERYSTENSISSSILRLGVIYGGNVEYSQLIPVFAKNIIDNKSLKLFNGGDNLKNFIYIDDINRILYKCISSFESEGIVNIVGEENVAIKDVASMLYKIAQKTPDFQFVNSVIGKFDCVFDNSKMVKLFGNNKINLEQGLKLAYNTIYNKEQK